MFLPGQSQENYVVFWDVELTKNLNPVPILSHSECNVTSHVEIRMQLTKFIPIGLIPNSLLSDAFFCAQNASKPFSARALPRIPLEEIMMLPKTYSTGEELPPSHAPPLDVFDVSTLAHRTVF